MPQFVRGDHAPDPTDPDAAARLLTARYAAGVDRTMWEREGVTLPPEQAVLAVLADPSPEADALVALVPRGRQVWALRSPGSPGALLHRGPLRTVRATRRGTRLKQAA
ncbi:hypothetical protein, partial [Nonomuraea sp. NPDC046570]|uniref:hypothetical protein n=1 Tax=Nonomuraea sp. NPDC046570 TaxID=3155255 RepID=UPI0033CE09AA